MNVRPHRGEYQLRKPIGEFLSAIYVDRGMGYALCRVDLNVMNEERAKNTAEGLPIYITLIENCVWLAPIPCRNGKVLIRYFPPMQEQ